MSLNQITPSQHALYYNILAKEMSSQSQALSNDNSQYSSDLYSDLSPYLSLLTNSTTNNSSSIYSMMNMFMMFLMQLISQIFIQSNSQTETEVEQALEAAPETTADSEDITSEEIKDIQSLTNDNLEDILRNQEGTSFIVAGNNGCGLCRNFSPVIESVNNSLNSKATFYNMDSSGERKLFDALRAETGTTNKKIGIPAIIKCVNGKATEYYDFSCIREIYDDETQMLNWFESKI